MITNRCTGTSAFADARSVAVAASAADPSGAVDTGAGTQTEGCRWKGARRAAAAARRARRSASDCSNARPSADISAAAWSTEMRVAGAVVVAGVAGAGAPATGRGSIPSSRSTVVRSRTVADARSRIAELNRSDRSPTAGGEAMVAAWTAWSEVARTAESSPCWSTPRAVYGYARSGSAPAPAMRDDSCAPVRAEACPTWSAKAAYPRVVASR